MRWQDETQAYDEAVGERLGLNAAERRCLGFLHGGPQPAGAIAAAIGLTPAAVTALVDRLEARGLLTRKRSEEDRRKVIIEGDGQRPPALRKIITDRSPATGSACSKRSATTSLRRSCAS